MCKCPHKEGHVSAPTQWSMHPQRRLQPLSSGVEGVGPAVPVPVGPQAAAVPLLLWLPRRTSRTLSTQEKDS